MEEEKYVCRDRKFPGSHESTHAGILFSFTTGSCSWPLTPKIIGFICSELFFFFFPPLPIFHTEHFNVSRHNGDSSTLQTYEVCPRQEVLSHLLLTLSQCNRLHSAALLLCLKSYTDLLLSFQEKEAC